MADKGTGGAGGPQQSAAPSAASAPSPPTPAAPLAQLRHALELGAIDPATYAAAVAALQAHATPPPAAPAPAADAAAVASLSGSGAVAQGPAANALGAGAALVQGDVSGTLNLGVIIEQARQPGASIEALRRAYLARLLAQTNQLPLLAGEPGSERVQLSSVYTALLTQRSQAADDLPPGVTVLTYADPQRQARPLSALAVLDAEPRLVLMAGPGGGKSSFVNVVAMSLAGELLGLPQPNLATLVAPLPDPDHPPHGEQAPPIEAQPWQHGPLLPVLVLLRDLASQLPPPGTPCDAGTVWGFITRRLQQAALGGFAPHLHEQLLQHGGLVLFDGLDEVPDAHDRRLQIKQAVQAFAATFSRCRLLVTSRTYAYQKQAWKLDGFAEVQLRAFDDTQIACFVDAWYAHMAALARLTPADAQDRAATLKAKVQRSPRLRELAERPLLLTLIAQLQTKGGGALPQRREALYDAAVTMLLDTWEKLKPRTAPDGTAYQEPSLSEFLQVGIEQIRRQLNRLAFEAHRDQPDLVGSADIPQGRLVQALLAASPGNPDVKVARLHEYLRDRAGILAEHGVGRVQFPHRSFQEYLAACHLTDDDFPDQLASLACADPNRWREVALLAGAKAARGSEPAAWLLAETLCHETAPLAEGAETLPATPAWGALLAGQLLVDSARLDELAPRNATKLARIRDWQLALLRRRGLPAVERALAGRSLAVLGDPRPEVMTLDGMQFVAVAPGAFWMGDDSQDDARPCHRVELDYPYAIGRFAVTLAQWREYLVRSGDALAGPAGQRGRDNEPVVDVSWHDAQRFCVWLTQAWADRLPPGWAVTLPSEAEWEKAARGGEQIPVEPLSFKAGDAAQALWPPVVSAATQSVANPLPRRAFPWGDDFNAERANIESGIGESSAAGAFGSGVSPVGAQDMAGNVWEWTRSLYGKRWGRPEFAYPYRADDASREDLTAKDEVLRVVRGGSWINHSGRARCASRFFGSPDLRHNVLGFRVVLRSSPVF